MLISLLGAPGGGRATDSGSRRVPAAPVPGVPLA